MASSGERFQSWLTSTQNRTDFCCGEPKNHAHLMPIPMVVQAQKHPHSGGIRRRLQAELMTAAANWDRGSGQNYPYVRTFVALPPR